MLHSHPQRDAGFQSFPFHFLSVSVPVKLKKGRSRETQKGKTKAWKGTVSSWIVYLVG